LHFEADFVNLLVMQALIEVKFWSGLILEQLNKSRSFVTRDSQVLQAHPMCVEAQIEQLMIANDEALHQIIVSAFCNVWLT